MSIAIDTKVMQLEQRVVELERQLMELKRALGEEPKPQGRPILGIPERDSGKRPQTR